MIRRTPLLGPMALSLVGHSLLLLWILHEVVEPLDNISRPIQVALLANTAPESPEKESDEMEAEMPKEAKNLEQTTDEMPLAEATTLPEQGNPNDREGEEARSKRGVGLITKLNSQLPSLVTELNPLERSAEQTNYQGSAIPKLPGAPSVFDTWLGPVQSNLDQWVDPSGGVNARVTLASGQIVCIEIRGATTQELFNPWMSPAVPMTRLCGKERPKTIDLSNPWLRARPKTR